MRDENRITENPEEEKSSVRGDQQSYKPSFSAYTKTAPVQRLIGKGQNAALFKSFTFDEDGNQI